MRWSDELLAAARRLQAGLGLDVQDDQPLHHFRRQADEGADRSRRGSFERQVILGRNPGALRLLAYVPEALAPAPAVVMLLHGCQQDAASFAEESGWVARARQTGCVLLVPEQTSNNNSSRCFNWFRLADSGRGAAELESLREMAQTACAAHGCDRRKIFVVGLSAGGAMAAAFMATYPDIVSAGAVVAGLPVGCANSIGEALGRMASAGPTLDDTEWAARARAIGQPRYRGSWPRLSVWHGGADQTVDPANAELLVRQFRGLHRLADVPMRDIAQPAGVRCRTWAAHSTSIIEWWSLSDLDHAYPIAGRKAPGRWISSARVDATEQISLFFGLHR